MPSPLAQDASAGPLAGLGLNVEVARSRPAGGRLSAGDSVELVLAGGFTAPAVIKLLGATIQLASSTPVVLGKCLLRKGLKRLRVETVQCWPEEGNFTVCCRFPLARQKRRPQPANPL